MPTYILTKRLCSFLFPDVDLEFEESETYQHFREFYDDTLPEFKEAGKVIQFKVCCNYEPHLRGNVFVQFKRYATVFVYFFLKFIAFSFLFNLLIFLLIVAFNVSFIKK